MNPIDELTGDELDAAVAICEGFNPSIESDGVWLYPRESTMSLTYSPSDTAYQGAVQCQQYHPSRDWLEGGLIIDKLMVKGLLIELADDGIRIRASLDKWNNLYYGSTVLIAVMRCYVANQQTEE